MPSKRDAGLVTRAMLASRALGAPVSQLLVGSSLGSRFGAVMVGKGTARSCIPWFCTCPLLKGTPRIQRRVGLDIHKMLLPSAPLPQHRQRSAYKQSAATTAKQ